MVFFVQIQTEVLLFSLVCEGWCWEKGYVQGYKIFFTSKAVQQVSHKKKTLLLSIILVG